MKVFVFGLRGFPNVQGGVEKHCESLYTHFENPNIEFFIFRRKPYVDLDPNISYKHIHFIDLPSTTIKGFEAAFHSFLATIYTLLHRSDIIHIHNIGPALFIPLLRIFGKKVVVTYHSANYEHNKWNWFAKRILKLSEWLTFTFASHIIFVNKFMQQSIPQRYIHKTSYIPNGVNDDTTPSRDTDELKKFGLKPNKYILSVGRITPEKGFDILCEAFEKIEDKTVKLCIAGAVETEREYYNSLKEKIEDSNRFVFTGFVTGETLRQLYSHTKLYVLASRSEGFPLVLLDAMAYNNNILASDIPASHLVELPAESYFEAENIYQLTKKINKALQQESSHSYNLSHFNWKQISNSVYLKYQLVASS